MSELLELARTIAGWAQSAEQVEAFVARSRTTTVRAYRGEIESFTSAEPAGAGVRVVLADGRQGYASAGSLEVDVCAEALADARENAALATPDPWLALAEPDGVPAPHLDVCRADLARVDPDRKIALALELERATLAGGAPVQGVRTAIYGDAIGEEAVASTAGIAASWRSSAASVSVQVLAERDGEVQTEGGASVGRHPDELDVAAAAGEAVTRAVRLLGSSQPASRRTAVLLDPEVGAALVGILGATLSGEAVLKGRSMFAGRIGETVAAAGVTIVDDPTDAASLGAEPHDGEGLARRRNVLVEGGVLRGYLYNTHTARRAGTSSTASAARGYASPPGIGAPALRLVPGSATFDELVGQVGHGVYVQSVSGLHSGVNPVSGDFSVGVTGLAIRGGELAEPFREATMASTLQRMLLDVRGVGGDLRWWGPGAAGVSLVIGEVALGGA